MLPPDYSNGLANTASFITYYLTSCFILLCTIPPFLCFKIVIRQISVHIENTIKQVYFLTAQLFTTIYKWYNLWEELWQLQPNRQQHTQLKTYGQLIQTSPPYDEYTTKIRQEWISTPSEDQTTVFHDLKQDFQVSNVELSLDLHVPNVSLERIYASLVVHNDQALTEFIQGEERCLKFVNQDLTFLQELHIPSTFTNVSHTPTSLKQPECITLPTYISKEQTSKENNSTAHTQTVQPALGFTSAEVCQAQNDPTLTIPQLLEIEPCKDYTETTLQTLDGLHVMQPKRFLPLAQEVKKLAGQICKEETASQWAGLPLEKLLQEYFLEQLDTLQALDQLAPFTAAKEHLPGDIINILEHLGKVDNIPFNQLYSLVEDCADRYYTKVIQTLAHLMKNSFHDRQLILVNTARELQFLESYTTQQTKLWKVLSKYHNLPDHFHDLKSTLQTEFELLKTATSKNIQNIQEAVQSQQGYNGTFWPFKYIIHQAGAS